MNHGTIWNRKKIKMIAVTTVKIDEREIYCLNLQKVLNCMGYFVLRDHLHIKIEPNFLKFNSNIIIWL